MNSLSDDSIKLQIIDMKLKYSSREMSKHFGISKSAINDFLAKNTYKDWWIDYEDRVNAGIIEQAPEQRGSVEVATSTEVFHIETYIGEVEDDCTHFMIPDTQVKPGIDLDYLHWVGEYIADRRPDVIIHIGDHADMESLSSYDKGKKSAEGKRVTADINAAIQGMETLLKPLYDLQQKELARFGEIRYKPKMVLTLGNHEERIERHVQANPELYGFLSYDNLMYKEFGWEVYDFLEPATINGVAYTHYMANPMSGKPYGGMAMNVLKNVGESFTMGHKQTLDIATRFLPASGKQQWAIIAGACYLHDEGYKGYQGNHHWRGVIVKHNVRDGSYNPMFVDLDYLRERYG